MVKLSANQLTLIRRENMRQDILELLVNGPMSPYDISNHTGTRPSSEGVRLGKMLEQGTVWFKDGLYGLTNHGLAKVPESLKEGKKIDTMPRNAIKQQDEREGRAYRRLEEGESKESATKSCGYSSVSEMIAGAKAYSVRMFGPKRAFSPHQYNNHEEG